MRALIVEPAGGLWGSERALIDLIEAMSEFEVAVCCPPNTPLVAELERRNVRVLPHFIECLHEKSRWHRAMAAIGVLRACLSIRPHVIHLNQSGAWRVALPAARLLRLPVVCHVRIFEDAAYLAHRRPDASRLRAMIAVSDAVKAEIRNYDALADIPVHRIYDGYKIAPMDPRVRRDPNLIACVGRIAPIKGQEVLLDAIASNLLPDAANCLIVGGGESTYVDHLKLKGSSKVKWTGVVDDAPGLLRSCAILACPSEREPLGRVIFEAWNAGAIPVVFAGAGGSAEIISAANGGILYDEQTPTALANALAKAMALPSNKSACMITNGRAWLEANCSLRSYGQAVAAVLTKAAA